MIPIQTTAEEPINPSFRSQATRAPAIDNEYESFVPIKQNVSETFNQTLFDGTYKRVKKICRDNIKRGKDGNQVKTKQPQKKGRAREDFLEKHGLSHHIAPADFVSPFLPFKCKGYSTHQKEQISFYLFVNWTNLKATLAGAGEGGACDYDWKPFIARELQQHFGLYLFNGLARSPMVEQKSKPQSQDPVHGNDFIYHMFGPNAKRRHRHFKNFLAIQDPIISTPSRKKS